jgi:hypothetical protein
MIDKRNKNILGRWVGICSGETYQQFGEMIPSILLKGWD